MGAVMFHTGDRVRVNTRNGRGLYHGEVPEGAEGTVRGFREMETVWSTPLKQTVAVVSFEGVGERIAGLSALTLVRVAEAEPSLTEWAARVVGTPDAAKARRIANAHSSVTQAYHDLADAQAKLDRTLTNLREVEAL